MSGWVDPNQDDSIEPDASNTSPLLAAFRKLLREGASSINADDLPDILAEVGVDEEFVPALKQILAPPGQSEVSWAHWNYFFEVLNAGKSRDFQRMLFAAIGRGKENGVTADDLVEFGKVIHEEIPEADARGIIAQCGENGTMTFRQFWNWYRAEHGIEAEPDDDLQMPRRT
jgi:Ca2+-binding EF-hand superfamily protein